MRARDAFLVEMKLKRGLDGTEGMYRAVQNLDPASHPTHAFTTFTENTKLPFSGRERVSDYGGYLSKSEICRAGSQEGKIMGRLKSTKKS